MKKIKINLRTLLTVLSIMAILSFTVGGYLYYSSLKEFSKVRAYKESAEHLKDLGNNIDAFLNWSLLSVKSIAGLKEIKQSLLIIDEVTLADTNALLEQLRHDLHVSVCYLMDYSGNTIASSNHGEPNSFVGKNYGFRPYFKQAIQGKPSIYMALGITSMERGVYYSHPVFGKDEKKPLGVAVIKASIEIIERDFLKPFQGIVMLTDPHGLVFVSNRPDWLYHLLWQTSPEIVEVIEKQRQFGTGPWNWIGVKLINQDHAIDSQGNEYRVHKQGLANYPDWHLVYLHSHDEIMETVIGPLRKSVGVIVILLCMFFGFVVIFLFLKANTEIIQRKAVEIELRENEALLEDTGLMARVGGWQLDVETMAITWTKETYRIHEVSPGSKPALSKAIEFFHPDDRESLSQAIQLALDRGEPYDMELQFITAKGNKLWTRTNCRPEVVDGKTVKLRGTFQDITERKRAEEALMANKKKLQATLDATPFPLAVVDLNDEKISYWSRSALER
ncbi:MAG: PAS domain-containing protein [Desulfobacteraceae bacterium]|nr:PAS domain-containing protein [Desulfobacteraceae bacterium]